MSRGSRLSLWTELSRPFTLVAPALGVVSGAVTAAGADPPDAWSTQLLTYSALGALMAAVLNAASNSLNQIYDLEIDRVNRSPPPCSSTQSSA